MKSASHPFPVTPVLGIPFIHASAAQVAQGLTSGGLLVAPSGPNLAIIDQQPHYAQAVRAADFAIADSAWMVIAWRVLAGQRIPRVSGLAFLRALLDNPDFRNSQHLWVMPDAPQSDANAAYIESLGIPCPAEARYCAPLYPEGPIEDPALLQQILQTKARYVIINLGGLTQERLGYSLRQTLPQEIAIVCTGAALAFLSGQQVSINPLSDRLYIGWLLRCLSKPRTYVPRYLGALPLPLVLRKWKNQQPKLPLHPPL